MIIEIAKEQVEASSTTASIDYKLKFAICSELAILSTLNFGFFEFWLLQIFAIPYIPYLTINTT